MLGHMWVAESAKVVSRSSIGYLIVLVVNWRLVLYK